MINKTSISKKLFESFNRNKNLNSLNEEFNADELKYIKENKLLIKEDGSNSFKPSSGVIMEYKLRVCEKLNELYKRTQSITYIKKSMLPEEFAYAYKNRLIFLEDYSDNARLAKEVRDLSRKCLTEVDNQNYKVGDSVASSYNGKAYTGVIKTVKSDGSYEVSYPDNSKPAVNRSYKKEELSRMDDKDKQKNKNQTGSSPSTSPSTSYSPNRTPSLY